MKYAKRKVPPHACFPSIAQLSLFGKGQAAQWTLAIACAIACTPSWANCTDGKKMIGVNLAGAEFNAGKLPGIAFTDYVYPDAAEMRHFRALGMNAFRLPVLWERLQPTLFGELDPAELQKIKEVLAMSSKLNNCLILDIHNYGEYRGKPIGSAEVPAQAFIELWRRIRTAFPQANDMAFGLMNEPSKLRVADWEALAEKTVAALRKDNSKHLILVAAGRWSGAHDWNSSSDGMSNADAFRSFRDPAGNAAIEIHQYVDRDFSGTTTTCVAPAQIREIMTNVTHWAELHKQRLFLGEFGTPSEGECLKDLDVLLDAVDGNSPWIGSTYWAAGRWWGSYPLSIEPGGETEKPQAEIIKKHIPR